MAGKILIIDDDDDFIEAVANLLETKGYEVISATNGEEGFDKARIEKPGLLLLDVMMAHKTEGFDIARNLKDHLETKNIPVIIVTGIRKEMNLAFCFEPDEEWLPVKAVLEKPVKPEILLKAIEENISN